MKWKPLLEDGRRNDGCRYGRSHWRLFLRSSVARWRPGNLAIWRSAARGRRWIQPSRFPGCTRARVTPADTGNRPQRVAQCDRRRVGVSIATALGFIALAGLAAEFGVVMLIYVKHAWEGRLASGQEPTFALLDEAIRDGAVLRVRPKAMTVSVIIAGLLPSCGVTAPGPKSCSASLHR